MRCVVGDSVLRPELTVDLVTRGTVGAATAGTPTSAASRGQAHGRRCPSAVALQIPGRYVDRSVLIAMVGGVASSNITGPVRTIAATRPTDATRFSAPRAGGRGRRLRQRHEGGDRSGHRPTGAEPPSFQTPNAGRLVVMDRQTPSPRDAVKPSCTSALTCSSSACSRSVRRSATTGAAGPVPARLGATVRPGRTDARCGSAAQHLLPVRTPHGTSYRHAGGRRRWSAGRILARVVGGRLNPAPGRPITSACLLTAGPLPPPAGSRSAPPPTPIPAPPALRPPRRRFATARTPSWSSSSPPRYDLPELLRGVNERSGGVPLIGCSTAGQIATGEAADAAWSSPPSAAPASPS